MSQTSQGTEIEKLVRLLSKMPGLGPRSGRRAALHLIRNRERVLLPLMEAMGEVADRVVTCSTCNNLDTRDPCGVCADRTRDHATIVLIATVSDLWALEKARTTRAVYHVLGNLLSPLEGIGPDDIDVKGLVDRVAAGGVSEVVVALPATVEGATTAHYAADTLKDLSVKVTGIARGVPVGGDLEHLDEGTLAAAMRSRTAF